MEGYPQTLRDTIVLNNVARKMVDVNLSFPGIIACVL